MSRPLALVSAARGVGDIVRVTPLVRVFTALGYDVDLLLAPDYADAVSLVEGGPGVRRVFYLPSPWSRDPRARMDGIERESYEVATFTTWTLSLRSRVRARRALAFSQPQWLREGDAACVAAVARDLGWSGPLPPPFAVTSGRRFGLPPGTVALHPGCKPDWPWKKWHGFDELAAALPEVALVGTPSDLENAGTYFARPFAWPPHARDFIGRLSLADTAALIAECAALVSNDSGLMHVGVALGVPTLGVFGITSPAREALPAPNMLPVTKGLPCEPACRRAPWGRRDCHLHLQCLRALTAGEVLDRLTASVPTCG
jgi:ADP-heptose:LPS heptosyltransferase